MIGFDFISCVPERLVAPRFGRILGRAQSKGWLEVEAHRPYSYSSNKHHRVVEPIDRCVSSIRQRAFYLISYDRL